ncbi:hypothetical protein B566_EDAN018466, partial [Ephemera danica]
MMRVTAERRKSIEKARESAQQATPEKIRKIVRDIKGIRGRHLDTEVWRACVPQHLISKVILAYHEGYGHFGSRKISSLIGETFTWNNMDRTIRKTIASCDLCQKSKHRNQKHPGAMQPILPEGPGEIVCLDIYGPLPRGQYGMEYVLVVVDAFSKFVALYALRRATAAAVIRPLRLYYLPNVRRVLSMLSDHGSQFTSKLYKKFAEEESIQLRYSSIRNPQSNPAERIMRELGLHSSTGYTPHELQFGQRPRDEVFQLLRPNPNNNMSMTSAAQVHVYARQNMQRAASARKEAADAAGGTRQFAVGDRVLFRAHRLSSSVDKVAAKFFLLYEGPYCIAKVLGTNAYLVRDNEGQERTVDTEVWRACVPQHLISKVILAYHEGYGHFGSRKISSLIGETFTWNNMDRTIRKTIASCDLCQKSKHRNQKHPGAMQPILPEGPGEIVCLDIYGPLPRGQYGMEYVLVVVDAFSKFVALYALRRATAAAVIRPLRLYYLPNVRRVLSMLSDHGSQFTSKLYKKFAEEESIQLRYSSIRNPQSNPAERIMRELG